MMAFQDLKASPFGDLLNNPSGWTAKGGQPGDARGIVPAHVKGSTPDSTQGSTQPSAPEDTSTRSTPDSTPAGTPEERTPADTQAVAPDGSTLGNMLTGTQDKPSEGGAAEATGSAGLAGPMDSIPEATKPVDSTPDAPTDTAESTPPDKPQDALSEVPLVSSPSEGAKEAPDTPEDTQRDRTEEASASSSPDTQPAEKAPDETDSTLAKAPEAARMIPDRAAARERLLKELEDRPELADAFLKMFSLMLEAPGAKKAAPSVPKTEAPAPPEEADPVNPEPAASPAVPDQAGTASDAAEEDAPSPETTPETPTASPKVPSPEPTSEMADPVPETPGSEDPDPGPETLLAEETNTPAEDVQRPSDGVSDLSKVITPSGDEKAVTGESTKFLDLSPAIDAAIRKSLRDIFASRHKDPAPAPVDAMPALPDSDDPLQILSAAMEPVEQARAAKEEETKVDQLLTLEQLTRNELIAMEAVLKELRTLARRQEVHLSLNRGAVKNGLTEVRQNLSDFREFLSTKSEPTEEDAEAAETPAEVSLADLAERIDYLQTVLEQLPARSEKPVEPLPDAKALKASYDETLEQMAHIPNELDEGIQKVLGNAQRQVDWYCTKFLSVHKKEDTPLRKALPFIAAFLGGFLGALVVGQALFH